MKIFIACSKAFYPRVEEIKDWLEEKGCEVILPNSYDNPGREQEMKDIGAQEHAEWKAGMLRLQLKKVADTDAVLILNFDKNGVKNYIGGATFIEVFKAFELNKPIYFYNPIPDGILRDELLAMQPNIINGELNKITITSDTLKT